MLPSSMLLLLIKRGFICLSPILLVCPILFQSCKKSTCSGSDVDTLYIDPTVKSSVAYKGTDTLIFLTETNDTLMLTGNGSIHYFNSVSNSTSCEGINKRQEGFRITFASMDQTQSLFHSLYVSPTNDNQTRIAINYKNINYVLPYENLRFPWTKSLEINGKTYDDIFITQSSNQPDSLYYSLKAGIVRLKFPTGELLQKL